MGTTDAGSYVPELLGLGDNTGGVIDVWRSQDIDFTQPGTYNFTIPAWRLANAANFYPQKLAGYFLLISGAGTCTAAPAWHSGNDASKINLAPVQSTPTTTQINNAIAAAKPNNMVAPTGAVVPTAMIALTTVPTVVVDTGATGTGGFAMVGRLIFVMTYMSVT